jgi:hypothetical protein
MNPDIHDKTWTGFGISLLWDPEALNEVCPSESVRSLREFLRLHQAGWPEETLNLINNRALARAGCVIPSSSRETPERVARSGFA